MSGGSLSINLNSVVVQSNNHVCAEVDGEIVMMSIQQGKYYSIERVGVRIWELVAEPRPVVAVRDALLAEYKVDQATCESDLLCFLGGMLQQGLIELRQG